MKLAFTKKEYLQRVKKVRREMRTRKVDVLIATDPGNMNWLTGYDGWSFYVHQGVVIHVDQEEPIWFGRRMDESAALLRCFMKRDNLISYPEEYVQNLDKHPMSWLAEHLFIANDWQGATIATEMDNYYYTADAHRCLRLAMPEARFVDSHNLVNWCRAIKSDKEIEYMRIAGRITAKIHQRILDVARVGIPKSHVVSQIYETAIAGVDGYSGDYPSIVPLLPSGKEASASHITWDEKPFRANEGTFFEISGCYKRYHAPMSRTLYMGKPSARFSQRRKSLAAGHRRRPRQGQAGQPHLRHRRWRSTASCCNTASTARGHAAVTRSASATRRTGASAPPACASPTRPYCNRA